ncbi:MAG: hypothetical protein H6Q26_3507 [Bacteroidetes bacterium]|uniref:hypothetical protein n=1 Tax=unclassified Chitinophaga TaxID=2619133 RepID=UPI0009C75CF0|nr:MULTISPECIES: hypothetical protein [unclassified Chitinophaga]MBP1653350.1 hypothetical protein [Bacteroidota bacterium]OMP77481.1 hypothetical protein BW716_19810 [[Flexibacter] sp. ATCC 35208]WPV68765.1 hypothetical protein QQL36_08535 [Chitinophaga sp. LS1]
MKHIQFLAVIATILFSQSIAVAQDFALNKVKTTAGNTEQPTASSDFKLDVAQVTGSELVFRVTVENPGSDKIILSIKDANNTTLHQESLPVTLVYKARFNLADLQDGSYTFEIRRGKTRLAEKVIGIRTETSINRTVSVQ